jgi:hypothetical protein
MIPSLRFTTPSHILSLPFQRTTALHRASRSLAPVIIGWVYLVNPRSPSTETPLPTEGYLMMAQPVRRKLRNKPNPRIGHWLQATEADECSTTC